MELLITKKDSQTFFEYQKDGKPIHKGLPGDFLCLFLDQDYSALLYCYNGLFEILNTESYDKFVRLAQKERSVLDPSVNKALGILFPTTDYKKEQINELVNVIGLIKRNVSRDVKKNKYDYFDYVLKNFYSYHPTLFPRPKYKMAFLNYLDLLVEEFFPIEHNRKRYAELFKTADSISSINCFSCCVKNIALCIAREIKSISNEISKIVPIEKVESKDSTDKEDVFMELEDYVGRVFEEKTFDNAAEDPWFKRQRLERKIEFGEKILEFILEFRDKFFNTSTDLFYTSIFDQAEMYLSECDEELIKNLSSADGTIDYNPIEIDQHISNRAGREELLHINSKINIVAVLDTCKEIKAKVFSDFLLDYFVDQYSEKEPKERVLHSPFELICHALLYCYKHNTPIAVCPYCKQHFIRRSNAQKHCPTCSELKKENISVELFGVNLDLTVNRILRRLCYTSINSKYQKCPELYTTQKLTKAQSECLVNALHKITSSYRKDILDYVHRCYNIPEKAREPFTITVKKWNAVIDDYYTSEYIETLLAEARIDQADKITVKTFHIEGISIIAKNHDIVFPSKLSTYSPKLH